LGIAYWPGVRRSWGTWIAVGLALLLVAPGPTRGQAQSSDSEFATTPSDDRAALAPAQVLVDAVPRLAQTSISEARFDGTPDRGQQRVEEMQRFAARLEGEQPWPSQATSRYLAASTFDRANQLINLVEGLPSMAGQIARIHAGCDAWDANATQSERVDWATRTWPNFARLQNLEAGLDRLAESFPDAVDTDPLTRSADRLERFRLSQLDTLQSCLPPPSHFFVQVSPTQTYPGGRVLIQVGIAEANRTDTVRVTNRSVGVSIAENLGPNGGLVENATIPLDAKPGRYNVTASWRNETATTTLAVKPAPTRLAVQGPTTVQPGQDITLKVRLTSPSPSLVSEADELAVGGFTEQAFGIENGTARLDLSAPDAPGTLNGTIHFEGTKRLQAASTSYTVSVREQATKTASVREPATTTADTEEDDEQFGSYGVPESPSWTTLALVFAGMAVLAAAAWFIRRALPRATAERDRSGPTVFARHEATTFDVLAPARRGIVVAFASIVIWLRSRGVLEPSQTPREIGNRLERFGVPASEVVAAFEAARYGPEDARDSGEGSSSRFSQFVDRVREVMA
jgi:hypothetical protein